MRQRRRTTPKPFPSQPQSQEPPEPMPSLDELNQAAIDLGMLTPQQTIFHLKLAIGRNHHYIARRQAHGTVTPTDLAIRQEMAAIARAIHFLQDGEEGV